MALYTDLIARAAIDGISRAQGEAGVDIGAAEQPARAAGDPRRRHRRSTAAMPTMADAEATGTAGSAVPFTAGCRRYQPAALAAPEGEHDDLKKISGIGPVLEGKTAGISATRKSTRSPGFRRGRSDQLDKALNTKGRISRDDWMGGARSLVGG